MRTIYIFDLTTGRYLRSIQARDPSKDADGNIVYGTLAKDMTEVSPPECPEGYWLCWTGTEWEQVKNSTPVISTPQTEEERWASLSAEQKAEEIRAKRDGLIEDIIWRVERYQTQLELGITTTDSEEQYREVLQYIEDLRQVPEQASFPDFIGWPNVPKELEASRQMALCSFSDSTRDS